MQFDFRDRVVLVTGSGRGIGEATSRMFAHAGATVLLGDRDIDSASRVASDIGGFAYDLDIAQEESVDGVVAEAEARHGPIDVLVNCAATLQNTVPPQDLSMRTWDRLNNVIQRGTYMMCVKVGLRMAQRGRGNIVNFASIAGIQSSPLHAYGPNKAALIHLTRCLAAEWGPAGVRVNAVAPGFTDTPGVERGFSSGMMNRETCARSTALGRLLDPIDIAYGVLFLASDDARGITGVTLPIDGGFLAASGWEAYGGLRSSPAE